VIIFTVTAPQDQDAIGMLRWPVAIHHRLTGINQGQISSQSV